MKLSLLFQFFLVLVLSATAQAGLLVSGAYEDRFELGMDQNTDMLPFLNAAVEYRFDQFIVGAEYFQGAVQNSGQASLSFSSQQQGGWLTGTYQANAWKFGSPYLRFGFGGYESSVTTTLLGVSSTSMSRVYMTGFGGVGLRFDTGRSFFTALETRLIFGENQTPQPAFAGMVRIGWEFGGFRARSRKQTPVQDEDSSDSTDTH